jgi:hypothetical protein
MILNFFFADKQNLPLKEKFGKLFSKIDLQEKVSHILEIRLGSVGLDWVGLG